MNKKILTKTLLPITTVALLGGIASSLTLTSCNKPNTLLVVPGGDLIIDSIVAAEKIIDYVKTTVQQFQPTDEEIESINAATNADLLNLLMGIPSNFPIKSFPNPRMMTNEEIYWDLAYGISDFFKIHSDSLKSISITSITNFDDNWVENGATYNRVIFTSGQITLTYDDHLETTLLSDFSSNSAPAGNPLASIFWSLSSVSLVGRFLGGNILCFSDDSDFIWYNNNYIEGNLLQLTIYPTSTLYLHSYYFEILLKAWKHTI